MNETGMHIGEWRKLPATTRRTVTATIEGEAAAAEELSMRRRSNVTNRNTAKALRVIADLVASLNRGLK